MVLIGLVLADDAIGLGLAVFVFDGHLGAEGHFPRRLKVGVDQDRLLDAGLEIADFPANLRQRQLVDEIVAVEVAALGNQGRERLLQQGEPARRDIIGMAADRQFRLIVGDGVAVRLLDEGLAPGFSRLHLRHIAG